MSETPTLPPIPRMRLMAHYLEEAQGEIVNGMGIAALSSLTLLSIDIRRLIGELVAEARAEGNPWSLIGEHLFCTPQAAQQRFGRVS